jgi:hypothetical protein
MSNEPGMPRPKRAAPPDVEPATIGDVRFEAIHWGRDRDLDQDGGYIGAYDAGSGKELWTLKVYTTKYSSRMERDVQDVFIERLEPEGNRLVVTDEHGKRYVVDTVNRTVMGK